MSGVRYVVPELHHRPARALEQIAEACGRDPGADLTLVGSSLGGFYATVTAERLGCRAALVNPAVHPHRHFERYLGPQKNLYTGEEFVLTQDHVEDLRAADPPAITRPERYWLFVETADEVLDYREAVAYYEAMYDASIRYLDDRLRQLFVDLEASGLGDDTTVIFTSDHGEEFLEHGKLVHTQIYPECLRMPLLVVHPHHREGLRIGALAQTIDFVPTILELAGVPLPPGLSGRSLVPHLRAPDRALAGEAYAEVKVLRFDGQI